MPQKTKPLVRLLTMRELRTLRAVAAWNNLSIEEAMLQLLKDNLESFREPLEQVGCDLKAR